MGLMHPRDVAKAAAVSRDWSRASCAAMRPALARRYEAARVDKLLTALGPGGALARLEAHAAEAQAVPGTDKEAERIQGGLISPAVRAVATEWMIEVCWDWKLESTTVFLGVRYLDLWLATTRVGQLSRFQGIAISCLRAAFQRSRDAAGRRELARPAAWADVCDGAAGASDVSAACRVAARLLRARPGARSGDTAKLQLRRLWYQLLEAGYMHSGRVYVYMLSSFLLHLSLLDASLSRVPATLLATGALALSLSTYGFEPWPHCLESRSPLLRGEVWEVMGRLEEAQAKTQARQLRLLWSTGYNYEVSHEWLFLRAVVAAPAGSGGITLAPGVGRRGGPHEARLAAQHAEEAGGPEAAQQHQQAEAAAAVAVAAAPQQQQQQQPAHAAVVQQQQGDAGDGEEEVEQPAAAAASGGGPGAPAQAPLAHEQQQGQRQQAREDSSLSNQAVVLEEAEMDDSGTSPAPQQPQHAAVASTSGASGAARQCGQKRERGRRAMGGGSAQQQQQHDEAPRRQLRQRRQLNNRASARGVLSTSSQSASASAPEAAPAVTPAPADDDAAPAASPHALQPMAGGPPAAAPLPFAAGAAAAISPADLPVSAAAGRRSNGGGGAAAAPRRPSLVGTPAPAAGAGSGGAMQQRRLEALRHAPGLAAAAGPLAGPDEERRGAPPAAVEGVVGGRGSADIGPWQL